MTEHPKECDSIRIHCVTRTGLLKEEQTKGSAGAFEAMGSLLSTHLETKERMNRIQPLPDGIAARPVLGDAQ
jgi:hypothetical protein